jgi:hypothetical protein
LNEKPVNNWSINRKTEWFSISPLKFQKINFVKKQPIFQVFTIFTKTDGTNFSPHIRKSILGVDQLLEEHWDVVAPGRR